MTAQEIFNALLSESEVVITNKQYIKDNEIKSTVFNIHSIHSDLTVTVVDFEGNLYYELLFDDVAL